MSIVIFPWTIIDVSALEEELASSVANSFRVLAFVAFAIWEGVLPVTVLLIILPAAIVDSTTIVGVLAFSINIVVLKLADIVRTIGPIDLAMTIFGTVHV